MLLDRNGHEVHHAVVSVSDTARIKTVCVVRLIKDEGIRKTVIAEERYDDTPITERQLLYCLSKYPEASFAVIERVYELYDDGLPFS